MFSIKINDEDIYGLVKEEVDYDPTKTDELDVSLNINDRKDEYEIEEWVLKGKLPWIVQDVDDKVQSALGMSQLTHLHIY